MRKRKPCDQLSSRKRATLEQFKLECGCIHCGYKQCPAALDQHHVGPRDFPVAAAALSRSWAALSYEAQKTRTLCAICHRELHAGRLTLPEDAYFWALRPAWAAFLKRCRRRNLQRFGNSLDTETPGW